MNAASMVKVQASPATSAVPVSMIQVTPPQLFRAKDKVVREGMAAINDALERIGVLPDAGRDAFATIGLGGMRHADLFLDRGRAVTG